MSDFDDIGFQYKFTRDRTPSPRPKAMSNSSQGSIGNPMTMSMGMQNPAQQAQGQRRFSNGMPATIPAGMMQYQNLASYGYFKK